MYCNPDAVTFLARNVRSGLSSNDIASMAGVVEPEIDSQLAQLWYWPYSSSGVDLRLGAIPPAIVAIANFLVAAALEAAKTAFVAGIAGSPDGGDAMQIPYGTTLQRLGEKRLRGIAAGTNDIPELERRTPCRVGSSSKSVRPPVRRLW